MTKLQQIQTVLGVEADDKWGNLSQTALDHEIGAARVRNAPSALPWKVEVKGDDLWVRNVRATCFGGSADSMDSGETASGVSTRKNPDLKAVSLPMRYTGPHAPTRKALGNSPIPMMPFGLRPDGSQNMDGAWVHVFVGSDLIGLFPVIDLGPDINRFPKNAIDFTLALAKVIDPKATANSFEAVVSYRIIGGAKHL